MHAIDTKYMYTFTKHSQLKNNFKLIKIFQNEFGTLLNKVKEHSISHTHNLPTLISAPFNLAPQQAPLLSIITSATGSTRPRSTLHQGLFSSLVCVQLLMSVSLFPSTALLAG